LQHDGGCQALGEACAWHSALKGIGVAWELKLAKGGHLCYNTRRFVARLGEDWVKRLMRKREIVGRVRQELRAVLRLGPLALAALLIAALLWRVDSMALSGLFQSSPVDTPPPAPTTPTPSVTSTSTAVPTEAVTATTEPTLSVPEGTPTLVLTGTVEPTEPTATSSPTVTLTSTALPPADTPTALPSDEAGGAEPTPDETERYADEDSNLRFEWSMLFDSLSLFLSYLWLFCGVLVFLAIPIVFIVLWVASKRRRPPED
jgi:hypothetical protein